MTKQEKIKEIKKLAEQVEKLSGKKVVFKETNIKHQETLYQPVHGVHGLEKYPEFKPLVNKLMKDVITKINSLAPKIESEMPYKTQCVLEELITKLQACV